MSLITLDDIALDKKPLRLLVDSFKNNEFFIKNKIKIYEELGYLEIHKMDDRLYDLYSCNVVKNTNNGNSYVSFLIGLTSVPPNGNLITKGGSLPD